MLQSKFSRLAHTLTQQGPTVQPNGLKPELLVLGDLHVQEPHEELRVPVDAQRGSAFSLVIQEA